MIFYDRVIELVEEYRDKYATSDPFEILDELRICVTFRPMSMSISGFVFVMSDGPVITLNSSLRSMRKKLTAAHELWHATEDKFILDGIHMERSDVRLTDECEVNANLFAVELCIPDEKILNLLEEGESIEEIAVRLNVRPEMLRYKLKLLAYKGYDIPENFTEVRSDAMTDAEEMVKL